MTHLFINNLKYHTLVFITTGDKVVSFLNSCLQIFRGSSREILGMFLPFISTFNLLNKINWIKTNLQAYSSDIICFLQGIL